MKKADVKIDFSKIGKGISAFVRNKAAKAGSTIVYGENGNIVEEDPRTGKKKVLRRSIRK